MKSQDLNIHLKVVCGHHEILNCSNREKGAHINKNNNTRVYVRFYKYLRL